MSLDDLVYGEIEQRQTKFKINSRLYLLVILVLQFLLYAIEGIGSLFYNKEYQIGI